MELIRPDTRIDFMGTRGIAALLSAVLLIVSVGSLIARGLAFGVDFTGGVVVEVGYPQAVELPAVRASLAAAGYEDALVQHFGTPSDVLIRLLPKPDSGDGPQTDPEGARDGEPGGADKIGQEILSVLQATEPGVQSRRADFVGPQVGEELTERGGLAMLFALIMIMAYVMFRFQWKFAVGSVAALVHDVLITLGIFSLFQLPFDLSVLAALLAIIGYSLNDTIVVFDRIRENFLKTRKAEPQNIMNSSINQMLGRTIITSLTTLLVLMALFLLGGEAIHAFSMALIIGVVVGTYSSIYVASTSTLALKVTARDLMPVEKADRDVDGLP